MAGWFEHLVTRIGELPPGWAYLLLAVSAFLENVVPPVPGDTVVVFSAYLAGRGVLSWGPVYVSTCAGGLLGFLVMYYLGRSQGRAFLSASGRGDRLDRRLRARVISEDRLRRAERWLERFGPWLVLGNRFLTGVRSVIALAAGIGGMRWGTVAGLGLLSMALWNGLLLYAGMALGENWDQVTVLLGQYNRVLAAIGVTVAAALLLRRWRRRSELVDREADGT